MDFRTVVAAGADSSGRGTSPKGSVPPYVPSVRVRATPSFDDEDYESDFDVGIDELDEGGVVQEIGRMSSFRVLSSVGSSSSSCSSSEEEEVGFVSGEEEFETALERPYVGEDGEVEEEDMDVAFVEPPESFRPIAKLSEDDDDDDGSVVNGSESGEDALLGVEDVSAKENGIRSSFAGAKDEAVDEVDSFGIDNGVDDAVKVPETSILSDVIAGRGVFNTDEVQSGVVKPAGEGLLEVDGVKFAAGGDSVVESVNVAEPGLAFVEAVKPPIVSSSGPEKPEEDSLATEVDLIVSDGVKLISEGDGVVEDIQVDLQEPGVVLVNDLEEKTTPDIEEKDVLLDARLTEEDSLRMYSPLEDEVPMVSGENESVKVFNNVEETKGSEIKGVTEDSAEGEKWEVKVVESIVGEAVERDNGLDQASVAANDVEAEEIQEADAYVGVDSNSSADDDDDDEKLETGTDSATEDLDGEENGNDDIKRFLEETHDIEGSASDDEMDGIIFGSSEAAKQFLEELEQRSAGGSQSGAESSHDRVQMIDGQIETDSDEAEVDTDSEEGSGGKELFDSAALAALLKAATGGGSEGNVTLSAQDVSELFSVKRPAGLGSSLRATTPAPRQVQSNLFSSSDIAARAESESNLSEEDRKKLESIQQLRVKFLRLVHRLGQSSEDSIAAQVLYRLVLVSGRHSSQAFSLDAAKRTARELENQDEENLNFSLNILVIGKSGVGKSATINSIFGENKTGIDAFEPATTFVKEITGVVDGVHIRVFDTPGLKASVMDQGDNRKILASVKKATKKCPPDIVLYVDRLDSQTRDLNDLPLLKTITCSLGASIWRRAIVTFTHAGSAPPDGPSGAPLSYEVFVAQRTHAIQQSIRQAVGDLRLMNPSQMNSICLAENHPSCKTNIDGQKILPNGQIWRTQLLMLCYSMKILSEASALYKQQDPFDHQKLFGLRVRAPPLPYLLSWLLQSRTHPKLSADQGGDNGDSDIDLDSLSESEGEEEEDDYDQLPPFKPLRKSQLAKLNREQLTAYYEEYDYRVKLLQKKQLKEELKRMKEMKKGKVPESEFIGNEADSEDGTPAAVPVPLPDMVLPPSFDCDNPAYRYRFLEPSSQFLARPVLDNHGWDHDCGYDGVNLEQSLAVASHFPAAVTVQLTKDKKEFNLHLDSSVAAKHGENASTMAGFDIQNIGKKLAYIVRGETKFKNLKKNKTTAGFSVTFLGENIATGVKLEDQIPIGKRLVLLGSTGTVRSQSDAAYGANVEVKLREADFPIGQDQSSLGLSLVKWRGDLALGANLQSQFSVGRGSKVAVRLGLNNKSSGQITIRTSTSDQLQIALVGIVPLLIGIYRAVMPGVRDNYGSY